MTIGAAGLAMLVMLAGCNDGAGSATSTQRQPTATVGSGVRISFPPDAPAMLPAGGRRAPVLSVLRVDAPMRYGDFLWEDAGIAAGPVWVRVDLARQLISVFRGGNEIGSAVILFGADGKPTPRGRFPILARLRDHRSTLYDAAMPYTLRLTGDGVAIHGSNVREGAATHGCIGVPTAFAAHLFDAVRRGDLVTID